MKLMIKVFPKGLAIGSLVYLVLISGYLCFNQMDTVSLLYLTGVILIGVLLFQIHRDFQKNRSQLVTTIQKLERERLATVQSTKLASLGEMAAGLAHEINNPLAVIIGRGEMIQAQMSEGSATQEDIMTSIAKMNDMAVRISKIVSSMRKISKGSSQKELLPTNLFSVIEDIMNVSSERLRSSLINLDLSGIDVDLSVRANFTHLSQVIINILNNSFDELAKSPENKRNIWLSTEASNEEVLLKIKDSGSGIPVAVRQKIFEPFFTTKEIGKGTGLGLSISKGLMIGMGGDLTLDTDNPQTCFILGLKKA